MKRAAVAIGIVVVIAVAGGLLWWSPWSADSDAPGSAAPTEPAVDPALAAARSFATAWEGGRLGTVSFAPGSGKAASTTRFATANLTSDPVDRPEVAVGQVTRAPGDLGDRSATVAATVTWTLDGDRTWSYPVTIPLTAVGDRWLVAWRPSVIEPTLRPGEVLRSVRQPATRGDIVDSSGTSLVNPPVAKAIIGTTGPATPKVIEGSGGRIRPGDVAGLSGLQSSQDDVLAGTPGLRVEALLAGGAPRVLQTYDAVPGTNVAVTLDRRVQDAARQALATAPNPAALVAIRVSTGDVLAVANGPAGADGYNRAFLGRYPPGSTFKVITTWALLQKGITPDTPIDCPATVKMGREFTNAGGEVLGRVPFATDFAESCNTAFIGQARTVSSAELTAASQALGLVPHDLGVPSFGGSVPITDNLTEHAADMIGQGKVEASPLAMAIASASVAGGRTVTPRLVVGPTATVQGAPLPPVQIAQLRDLMRRVVTSGTGTAALGAAGGPVSGKTGTAEFGTDDPPRTHAWFIGFQGDVAFAVLVEDSGFGGEVAAPIAKDFLDLLAG